MVHNPKGGTAVLPKMITDQDKVNPNVRMLKLKE